MDLTQFFPRSPRKTLSDLAHIPRMIDKARALRQDSLGDYIYPCPLDKVILEFLKIGEEEFADYTQSHDEAGILSWIEAKSKAFTVSEKETVNNEILNRAPDTAERKQRFLELRDKIDSTRTDVTTWVDLIDLEEGRI